MSVSASHGHPKELLDDHRALEPPDPIPNSVVKRRIADGSVGFPHVRVGHRQAPIPKPLISLAGRGFCFGAGKANRGQGPLLRHAHLRLPCRRAPCARIAGRARSYSYSVRHVPVGADSVRDPAGRPAMPYPPRQGPAADNRERLFALRLAPHPVGASLLANGACRRQSCFGLTPFPLPSPLPQAGEGAVRRCRGVRCQPGTSVRIRNRRAHNAPSVIRRRPHTRSTGG